jgi:hypothetical protein
MSDVVCNSWYLEQDCTTSIAVIFCISCLQPLHQLLLPALANVSKSCLHCSLQLLLVFAAGVVQVWAARTCTGFAVGLLHQVRSNCMH